MRYLVSDISGPEISIRFLTPLVRPAETWVTRLSIIICVAITGGLALLNDYQNPDTLAKFGLLMSDKIWNGAYWALITSAFVHFDVIHLVANMYWMWVLGARLEQAIGAWRYLIFVLVAAVISSTCQLAVSDTTGIGMSGVVYAVFGFMWLTRHQYPRFREILHTGNIQLLLAWLMICVIITRLNFLSVGNAAHISGWIFGMAVAVVFSLRYLLPITAPALIALVGCSLVPIVWCPWSPAWLSEQAYNAHLAQRLDEALIWYNKLIELDPQNAWAFANRGGVLVGLGRLKEARADYATARTLDPNIIEPPAP